LVAAACMAMAGLWAGGCQASGTAGGGAGLVIAHRGASGHAPEHSLAAYALAYGQGADVLEPDVVLTRDGVAICAHDLTAERTTDVAERFAEMRAADGKWYWADLTLAQVRQLRLRWTVRAGGKAGEAAAEPLPAMGVVTLDEMLGLVVQLNRTTGRRVAVIPELKDPVFHQRRGLDLEGAVLTALEQRGWTEAGAPVMLQCFDFATLRGMREAGCRLRMIWLLRERPSGAQLDEAARWVNGIGPGRRVIEGDDGVMTDLMAEARARGLLVIPYTFGDDERLMARFFRVHQVDGLFTDFPATARRARDGQGE
jgi:glycerophosphoryl diester phosphodiesterase